MIWALWYARRTRTDRRDKAEDLDGGKGEDLREFD